MSSAKPTGHERRQLRHRRSPARFSSALWMIPLVIIAAALALILLAFVLNPVL